MHLAAALAVRAATNCPRGVAECEPLERKPLFEGFGLREVAVIGGAILATTIGLIVLTWLLVVLTGANRDYQLARAASGSTSVRVVGGDGTSVDLPRRELVPPRWEIRPSTWFGVSLVLAGALGAATWIALGAEPERSTQGALAAPTAPTTAAPTTVNPCPAPPLAAEQLPAGFDRALQSGFGVTVPGALAPGCYFHWKGPAGGVVTLIPAGDSVYGPRGEAQREVLRNGRTLWAGITPQGAAGVVFEERQLGGAPDLWYTLVSSTASEDELLTIAATLKRTTA